MKKFLSLILILTFLASTAFAQQDDTTLKKRTGPRRQLATIVFAGLGGAVLGLSTLSFYGRPQENLSNIAIGFAVGIIAGTIYVTFKSATTKDYYEDHRQNPDGQPGALLDKPMLEDHLTEQIVIEEPKIQWGPMIARAPQSPTTTLGGQFAFHF